MNKKLIAVIGFVVGLILAILIVISLANSNAISTITSNEQPTSYPLVSYPIVTTTVIPSVFSKVVDDFSCYPNECANKINSGVNSVEYPQCNPKVQINNTGASIETACDYWKIQQYYFATDEYVDLSVASKQKKLQNNETIVDGFLGLKDEILIHKNAVDIFLKAEENFNKLYGATRVGSTYYLPSYPNGYTFQFSGSLNKRAIAGSKENPNGLLFEGKYITPSNHFWGVAIDLNSDTNWGNRGGNSCIIDIPPEIVKVFEETGLRWGGRFNSDHESASDPMHFEYLPRCIKNEDFRFAIADLKY